MNEIVNTFLLAGDKFIPEMHLKQPGFTYSACGSFTKNKERIKKFKETGDMKYIYRNKLDKAYFQHDMAYGNFIDLARRTASDKVLRNKGFNIAENLKYDEYQKGLAAVVYTFFDKKSTSLADKSTKGSGFNNEIKQNEQLAKELRKPIIKKLKKEDNIWGANLADIQLMSKFNKGTRFLLRVIDIFSKYAWWFL